MKPWPFPKLVKASRCAVILYAALRYLAGDRRQLNTTRQRIRDACGLHPDSTTEAMKALDAAGWVKLRRGYANERRWYRLTFPTVAVFPWGVIDRSSAGKKRKRLNGQRPSKGARPLGGHRPSNPLRGRDAPGSPPVASPEHETAAPVKPRWDALERERLAEIRKRREAEAVSATH